LGERNLRLTAHMSHEGIRVLWISEGLELAPPDCSGMELNASVDL
jgi:hypothetical protein